MKVHIPADRGTYSHVAATTYVANMAIHTHNVVMYAVCSYDMYIHSYRVYITFNTNAQIVQMHG